VCVSSATPLSAYARTGAFLFLRCASVITSVCRPRTTQSDNSARRNRGGFSGRVSTSDKNPQITFQKITVGFPPTTLFKYSPWGFHPTQVFKYWVPPYPPHFSNIRCATVSALLRSTSPHRNATNKTPPRGAGVLCTPWTVFYCLVYYFVALRDLPLRLRDSGFTTSGFTNRI
jgi:hypothetical protein